MWFTEALKERLEAEGIHYQFKNLPKDVRTSFYVPADPNNPYGGGSYKQPGLQWAIYAKDILGPNWRLYDGLLPSRYRWGSWGELGQIVVSWIPKEDPHNSDDPIREQINYLMCPAALNLTSLDMRFEDDRMQLYQKHRPFRENTNVTMPHDTKEVNKILDNVVRSIRGLERIKEFAEPYLVQINDALDGFRQQVNKIKIKNNLINEREKPKFKL